jgi:lipid II:glycine glycyltransferase (peptidoglycan interpeptide bridge formation enzyme)
MEILKREIEEKEGWEDFFNDIEHKSFLQSFNWGEFQKAMGNKIFRWGFFKDSKKIAQVLICEIFAKRGNYFLIQHGPQIKEEKEKVMKVLLKEIKNLAKKEKAIFLKIAPLFEKKDENFLKSLGFRKSPLHANAYESTIRLKIEAPEEELLKRARKTTRYLIRQFQKQKNIEIFEGENLKDVENFYSLSLKTAKYKSFVPFSFEFLKNQFLTFKKENKISILFAKYNQKIVGGIVLIFWSNICFYHQAAFDPEFRKIPVSYGLVFEAIKKAKKRGCKIFDFWGFVDPQKYPKHPWAGPSLFKQGFGGEVFEYCGTFDFPFSKKYWIFWGLDFLRKIKKGL